MSPFWAIQLASLYKKSSPTKITRYTVPQAVMYVPLVSLQEGVPSVSAEGVDVYPSARASGSHHKPTIWRPLGLSHILEQVISEVLRKEVVFQETTFLRVLEGLNRRGIYELWWHHLKGLFLSFQKIRKSLKLDTRNSSYGSWKSIPQLNILFFNSFVIATKTIIILCSSSKEISLTTKRPLMG